MVLINLWIISYLLLPEEEIIIWLCGLFDPWFIQMADDPWFEMFIILVGLLPFWELDREQFPLLLLIFIEVPSMLIELLLEPVWLLTDIDVEGEPDEL